MRWERRWSLQKQFNSCVEPEKYDSSGPESLREVMVWVHEHTNLCLSLAVVPISNSDHVHKLKERLRTSLDRGTRLIYEMVDIDTESTSHANFSAMVSATSTSGAGTASVNSSFGLRRTPSAIPLSGVRRFDESSAAAQPLNFPSALPRPTALSAAHSLSAQTPKGVPLPSRTYLKKSGS
jgi:hypothetical protein